MPLYEYKCEKCGRLEEVIQKFSDLPLTECSKCLGKLHKLISNNSFHLKGSGWYVTDYQSNHTKAATATSGSCNKEVNKQSSSTSAVD